MIDAEVRLGELLEQTPMNRDKQSSSKRTSLGSSKGTKGELLEQIPKEYAISSIKGTNRPQRMHLVTSNDQVDNQQSQSSEMTVKLTGGSFNE